MQERQLIFSLLMNSSKHKTSETLAEPSDRKPNLAALTELANLRDDRVSFERFARRFPEFNAGDVGPGWWASIVQTTIPAFLPPQFADLYRRRESLRLVWRGDSEMLGALLIPETPPNELPLEEREAFLEKKDAEGRTIELAKPLPVIFDWQRSQIMYKPRTEFERALYALFRRSALAKVCANHDCPAPYFIAEKTAQRYHSDCAQVFQRQWKLQWWKEHGSKWRRKRSHGKRGKR